MSEHSADYDAGRTPEEQLLWDIFAKAPGERVHGLIGASCVCGDWSAQCGNDVPEQWRQHVNAAERARVTPPSEKGRADA